MEVELKKKYPLAVSADRAWAVLTDIRAVAGCMPGAQITEHAARGRLELHRMYGQQAEAFTFTLPLCRGLL